MEWRGNDLDSGLYITLGRKRNPRLLRQNQPIRSSEEVVEELMKHGYVVGAVGLDATRRRVMILSKVVFHNVNNSTLFHSSCNYQGKTVVVVEV